MNNNKIAIVSASLGIGGAERFAGLLSFILHDLGYEVHHIIILDHVDYEFKGTLVNLGKLFADERGIFRAIRKGKFIANYLFENNIGIVIDNRSRPAFVREVFTKWIYGNRKRYFMVHSSNLEMYFSFGAQYLYENVTGLVCVSHAIETKIRERFGFKNTVTVHNPVILTENTTARPDNIPGKYILYFGRLREEIKNFTLMLTSYKLSKAYEMGVKLLIIGDGPDEGFIKSKIAALQLESYVQLLPFQPNVTAYIQHAKCTILTSRFEGFPMSIVESLAAGTPVIAVDCESGPREIIQNGKNGLLVPNHNEEALAKAIYTLLTNADLYDNCKKNTQKSIEHLSLTNIAQQWRQLLA